MDSGRNRVRVLGTADRIEVTVEWEMSGFQKRIFEGFYNYELFSGTRWFNCPLPVAGGIEVCEVRFIGTNYTANLWNKKWIISGSLEVLNLGGMTELEYRLR